MRAPVGDRPAGVIPPPAEGGVAALVHIFHLRRLSEPEVKIQGRRRHLTGLERTRAKSAGNPHVHFLKFADAPVADEFARQPESPVAALLRPGLENDFIVAHGFDNMLAFVNRQRQRFFPIDILLGFRGGQIDESVPMIRRAMNDDMDVVPLHDFAEIGVFVGRLAVSCEPPRRAVEMILVHIANGENVPIAAGIGGIAGPLAAATDQGDAGTGVRAGQAGRVGRRFRRQGGILLDRP